MTIRVASGEVTFTDLIDGVIGSSWFKLEGQPTTAAPTDTLFNTSFGRYPTTGDILLVATNGDSLHYRYTGSAWDAVTEFIDGSLLVNGSVTADEINANTVLTESILANTANITGDLTVTDGILKVQDTDTTVRLDPNAEYPFRITQGSEDVVRLGSASSDAFIKGSFIRGMPVSSMNETELSVFIKDVVGTTFEQKSETETLSYQGTRTINYFEADAITTGLDSVLTIESVSGTQSWTYELEEEDDWSSSDSAFFNYTLQGYNGTSWENIPLAVNRPVFASGYRINSTLIGWSINESYSVNISDNTYTKFRLIVDPYTEYFSAGYNTTANGLNCQFKITVVSGAAVNSDNYVDSFSINDTTGVITVGRTGALANLTDSIEPYVSSRITSLVDSSPATLDTLNELAAALGDDPNFATTTATSIGLKANKSGDTFTGDISISKESPKIKLIDNNSSTGTYPAIEFETTNNQGVTLYHNEFDSELPFSGYGLVLDASPNNSQYPSVGELGFVVKGEIYAGSTTLGDTSKVWHAGNLTPFDGAYSSLSGAPTNVSSFTNDAGYITSIGYDNLSQITFGTSLATYLTDKSYAIQGVEYSNGRVKAVQTLVSTQSTNPLYSWTFRDLTDTNPATATIMTLTPTSSTTADLDVKGGGKFTGTISQSYDNVIWSHSEATHRPLSKLTYAEAGSVGTTGTNITDVYGESDLSAIDNDATFTYADAWDAVESHGGRLPTLAEILDEVGEGSGQGYDSEYLWTCTPAGAHHVWVVKGNYSLYPDKKIVDIKDPLEVYRTRCFFDVSRNGRQVHYSHDGKLYVQNNEISSSKIDNWNDAHGWGNHADAGYLTTYTDTNTTYTAGTGLTLSGTEFSLTGSYLPLSGGTVTGKVTIEDNVLEVGNKSADNYVEISQLTNGSDYGFTFQHANASVFRNLQGSTNQVLALGDVDPTSSNTLLGVSILQSGTYHNRLDLRGNGAMYIGSGTDRVFADNYHPNADKWTTPKTNTVTLTGDVTGSGSASVDGSGNWTVTVPAVVGDDSHNHTIANVDGLQAALNSKVDDSQLLTNVPSGAVFTDTDTTYTTATSSVLGLVKIGYSENGKNYPVELSNGQMYVNVPWVDTDTNTWRGIHDTPVNGATTTSISSNWAFDNVKTAVPANALFTDTVYTHPTYAGDDFSVDTGALTGATVISDLDFNVTTDGLGHVTDANATVATRTLTAANIGAAPASHSHGYVSEGGTSFNGEYPLAVRTSANTIYSDNNIRFRGSDSRLSVDGNILIGGNNAFHDGYHPNADKWTTARTITLGGDLTGSVSIDGSANVTLSGQVVNDSHNHNHSDGGFTVNGKLTYASSSMGDTKHEWRNNYIVNNTNPAELKYSDNDALPNGGAYRFSAHIYGTGTDNWATAVFWNQNGSWKINVTQQSGTSSNNPEFVILNGKPHVATDHTSNYTIAVYGERLELGEGTGTDNNSAFGSDSFMSSVGGVLRYNSSGSGTDYTYGQRVFHDTYHPNANKWTTARSHTVTLTGDVTGTATQSVDGTGNKTWSLTTAVANDSHTHDGRYYTETESDSRFVNVTGDSMSGNLSGSLNSSLTGFILPQNPEGQHIKSPFFFNDIAFARLRGATVSVDIDGTPMTSTSAIDSMLNTSGDFWGMSTSGVSTVTITITSLPKGLNYGAFMGLTFGNPTWRAKGIILEYSTDGGTTWTTARSTTTNSAEFYVDSFSSGATATNALRWTLSDFNTTSLRVASLFAYNYNSSGMKGLYVSRDGGEVYGSLGLTGGITVAGGINGLTLANGISGTNFNITGVNQLQIADPGEGILFTGGASGNINLAIVDDASDNRLDLSGTNATMSINDQRVFADDYHPNADKWTTARTLTLSGDASGSVSWDGSSNATLSVNVVNDSHSHSNYITSNANDTGTGGYSTSGTYWEVGNGTGSVAINTNDGYGNANLTFNHHSGRPDISGNAARIEVNVDSSSGANMNFEVKSGVTGGTTIQTTSILNLSESQVTAYKTLYENSNRVFTDGYHPNADKWTTARSHTVTLTGDVTGSASQSVDGTGNRTWTISTAVSNDSHNHNHSDGGFQVNGKLKVTAGADIVSTSSNPFRWQRSSLNQTGQDDNVTVHLDDSNIYFTHNNDSDGDASGYNFRYMSGGGAQNLVNFSSSAFTYKGNNVFHDTYHPNADKWTSARTITLGGDLTGSVSIDGSANVTLSAQVVNDSHNHDHSDGAFTVNGNLTVTGNVQHTGLTLTSGTDVDQLYTATTALSISTAWQDTGVNGSELSTGTYIVQLYTNDHGSGGAHYSEIYSGVMSWYSGNTNNASADEIALHNAGHAQTNNGAIFLRVLRTYSADVNDLKLQIKATYNRSANSNYTIKFRRMI